MMFYTVINSLVQSIEGVIYYEDLKQMNRMETRRLFWQRETKRVITINCDKSFIAMLF